MVPHRLVVLYGVGGLSDVGRHAVAAALELPEVDGVTVITRQPELLDLPNWNCGCEQPHSFSQEEKAKLKIVKVESWNEDLSSHFQHATAVVSCLGNRQPFTSSGDSAAGNHAVIKALQQTGTDSKRVVVCSSTGVEEDWPPMESWTPGKVILSAMFMTISFASFRDLTKMERSYRSSPPNIDYLLVRPVGIGEDVKPVHKWKLQEEKYRDILGPNMAKMDVARFMVEEAVRPTRHRDAVSIGSEPEYTENGKLKL
jgi:NAD(P)H-binding